VDSLLRSWSGSDQPRNKEKEKEKEKKKRKKKKEKEAGCNGEVTEFCFFLHMFAVCISAVEKS
jgi:hypothetical protein